jgi:alpha-tubulin suppressor-like RCC1 family protein
MKNKKIRIVSFMFLIAMVIGIAPIGLMDKSYATESDFVGVKQVSAGESHTIFLKEDGTVWAAGGNSRGQLGTGDTNNRDIPTKVDIDNVKKVSAGDNYTMFLKEDGTVWATGRNNNGQLGTGDTNNRDIPTKTNIENVKQVSAGGYHTIFLKEDGTVWATGDNGSGQLGLGDSGDKADRNIPMKVDIDNVKQVLAGGGNTIFLKEDGTVWATGNNGNGQLGFGDIYKVNIPTKVDIENVKQISIGGRHTIFLKEDGTVWATGYNGYGQLGLGDETDRNTPTKIDIENVKQVSAGGEHTVFLKKDGMAWTTGHNDNGQLGLGDDINKDIPQKTYNIEDIKQVSAGDMYTMFLKEDGTVWGTGNNGNGQLGFGDLSIRYIPTLNENILVDTTDNSYEKAVKKAEKTKLQADIDSAKELVNKLPDSETKNNLISRLNKVQTELDNDEEYKKALEAVEKAKKTQSQEDIDKAKELVNNLPNGANKDSLIEQINKIEETNRVISMPNITVVNGKEISVLLRDTQIEGTYNGLTFTVEGNNTRYTGTPENVSNTWTKIETLDKGKIWIRSIPAPITEQETADFY